MVMEQRIDEFIGILGHRDRGGIEEVVESLHLETLVRHGVEEWREE
jgi:hypothetical protein